MSSFILIEDKIFLNILQYCSSFRKLALNFQYLCLNVISVSGINMTVTTQWSVVGAADQLVKHILEFPELPTKLPFGQIHENCLTLGLTYLQTSIRELLVQKCVIFWLYLWSTCFVGSLSSNSSGTQSGLRNGSKNKNKNQKRTKF